MARRPFTLLGVQIVVAAALPWLIGRVLVPGQPGWAVAAVAGTIAFAAFHAHSPAVWLLPVSAVVSVAPAVGPLPAAVLAIAVVVVLVLWPPESGATRAPLLRWTAAGLLVAAGALVATSALIGIGASDDAYEAGQQLAAEAWNAPLVTVPDSPMTAPPIEPTTATLRPSLSSSVPAATSSPSARPLAALTFTRPGTSEHPVSDQVIYVGTDVTESALAAGPGHYPATARPGKPGNFAVAGHRTGWGSPFLHLDQLRPGDHVTTTDRSGTAHVYVVDHAEIVEPDASWVLGPDPLGTGRPTLTLTTCDPPHADDHRMIVFATLESGT